MGKGGKADGTFSGFYLLFWLALAVRAQNCGVSFGPDDLLADEYLTATVRSECGTIINIEFYAGMVLNTSEVWMMGGFDTTAALFEVLPNGTINNDVRWVNITERDGEYKFLMSQTEHVNKFHEVWKQAGNVTRPQDFTHIGVRYNCRVSHVTVRCRVKHERNFLQLVQYNRNYRNHTYPVGDVGKLFESVARGVGVQHLDNDSSHIYRRWKEVCVRVAHASMRRYANFSYERSNGTVRCRIESPSPARFMAGMNTPYGMYTRYNYTTGVSSTVNVEETNETNSTCDFQTLFGRWSYELATPGHVRGCEFKHVEIDIRRFFDTKAKTKLCASGQLCVHLGQILNLALIFLPIFAICLILNLCIGNRRAICDRLMYHKEGISRSRYRGIGITHHRFQRLPQV
ncbi:m17 protein [Murid betaherpesvirus 1]|uniref:M17 protein n=1 Tax=Murid herpesvirus 1 TaxID=10366 RepID=H2A174_MUHV1|nr:m17 protein [Murid betaherpesvirus 1]